MTTFLNRINNLFFSITALNWSFTIPKYASYFMLNRKKENLLTHKL